MDYWYMGSMFRGPPTGVTIEYYPIQRPGPARAPTRPSASGKPTTCGGSAWARGALSRPKRRVSARASMAMTSSAGSVG
jgi:hypothetical protein